MRDAHSISSFLVSAIIKNAGRNIPHPLSSISLGPARLQEHSGFGHRAICKTETCVNTSLDISELMTGWGIVRIHPPNGLCLSENHSGQSLVASLLHVGLAAGTGMTQGDRAGPRGSWERSLVRGLCRRSSPLGPGLHPLAAFPAPD